MIYLLANSSCLARDRSPSTSKPSVESVTQDDKEDLLPLETVPTTSTTLPGTTATITSIATEFDEYNPEPLPLSIVVPEVEESLIEHTVNLDLDPEVTVFEKTVEVDVVEEVVEVPVPRRVLCPGYVYSQSLKCGPGVVWHLGIRASTARGREVE